MSDIKVSSKELIEAFDKFSDELTENELLNRLDNEDECTLEDRDALIHVTVGLTSWHSACRMLAESLESLEAAGIVDRGLEEEYD